MREYLGLRKVLSVCNVLSVVVYGIVHVVVCGAVRVMVRVMVRIVIPGVMNGFSKELLS